MNNTELYNLSIEDKKMVLKAIANGSIDKSDLENPEMIAIIKSQNGWNLIHSELWGMNEYKHQLICLFDLSKRLI